MNRIEISNSTESNRTLKGVQPPLVSVIIPTYNRAWSLRKTVQSVFQQTYRPIECVVVDDGSTDQTAAAVATLATECPQGIDLRYIKKENEGANPTRNRGLRESHGSLICFLDSDDLLLPDSVTARASVLIDAPSVDLCYGLASLQDEAGDEIRKIGSPWPGGTEARIASYTMCSSAPLVRRDVCERSGPWREDDTFAQEYEYFTRLKYFSRGVVFIDRTLSIYLRHDKASILDQSSVPFILALFRMVLIVKGLVLYGLHDTPQERHELSMQFRHVAKQLYRLKDYRNACAALREALLLEWRFRVVGYWIVSKVLQLASGTGHRS